MTTTAKETRRIEDIKIGSRFRKDLGNIDSLTKTILDVGLLQPIGITDDNKLVYGARRLEACKRLGWSEIPVNIIPLKDIIKGEFIENSARKDFTFSERQAILAEIENRRIGHRVSKEKEMGKVRNLQTFQQYNKGKASVEIVADYTGTSPRQLSKEKAIVQTVKQNPELKHIIDKLDSGEISVNEASKEIELDKQIDAEEKKKGEWRGLREEVLKGDSHKCRQCGSDLHLDVYTVNSRKSKTIENLETLCQDCHKLKVKFGDELGLINSFASIFQLLTGMSGRKYFNYSVIGNIIKNKEEKGEQQKDSDHISKHFEKMKDNPYVKLKRSSDAELVSKTRDHRKQMLYQTPFVIDNYIYFTQEILHDLIPILHDFSEMIDNEADARHRKDNLSKP